MRTQSFVDREEELEQLNGAIGRTHPGPGQLIVVYGRRRVGKTALLEHWGTQTGLPYVHWSVQKGPAVLQRQRFYARLLKVRSSLAPAFDSWEELWDSAAEMLGDERNIVVIDELPYAAKSDPEMLSSLQHAWDWHFNASNTVLVLAGSQVRMMEEIRSGHAPLGGRVTSILNLNALPFSSFKAFFPGWHADERVAAYATVGGIPAYMEWLNPNLSLITNIKNVVLSPGSMFREEPELLLVDEVREPGAYLSVLQAIGLGAHTHKEIVNQSGVKSSSLPEILSSLRDLRLVQRRLPATIPPSMRKRSRRARWHIQDHFLKFYFWFIAPYRDTAFNPDKVMQVIQSNYRSFVGKTAFEDLCRRWVLSEGRAGRLPFEPEICESYWRKNQPEVDVVAINWQTKDVLVGECKWGDKAVGASVVRDLFETRVSTVLSELPGRREDWTVHPFLFTRKGLTQPAEEMLVAGGGRRVNLGELDETLP